MSKCRFLIFCAGLIFASASGAANLSYSLGRCAAELEYTGQQAREIFALREHFKGKGLPGAVQDFGTGKGLMGFDDVFVADNLSGPYVMFKLCLQPTDDAFLGKFVALDSGLLYHGRTESGVAYALAITDTDLAGAQALLQGSEKLGLTSSATMVAKGGVPRGILSDLSDLLVPAARAKPGDGPPHGVQILRKKNAPRAETPAEDSAPKKNPVLRDVLVNSAACATGLGKGVIRQTIGIIQNVAQATVRVVTVDVPNLVRDPKGTMNKLVTRVKEIGQTIKGFSLSKAFQGAKGGFDNLRFDKKVELICHLVGRLGSTALISLLAGPASPAFAIVWTALSGTSLMNDVKDYLFPSGYKPPPVAGDLSR